MSERTYSVDGVPLAAHAFNVVDLTEDMVPPLRGSDATLAGVPGAAHRPRVADSMVRTLAFHIMGQDFGGATAADWEAACWENFRAVSRLLQPGGGRQFVLGRNWTDHLGAHHAEARGIATDIKRVWLNRYTMRVTVDVLLADPYFYGDEQQLVLKAGQRGTVRLDGDADTTAVRIELAGALTNPTLVNLTTSPQVGVRVGASVATGDKVTVDVEQATVRRASDGASLIGAVTHSGARHWFGLVLGSNEIALEATGAGKATVRWRERWI